MVEIVESKEEILRNSINLIWKATGGKVVTVTFNNLLCLATISLDNGTNTTVYLERIADYKNVPKCQLYNKSVNDNSEHNQGMDKLINVFSGMFKQSKNSMQVDDIENVNNERVNNNNQNDERNDESEMENINNLSRNININIQDNNNDQNDESGDIECVPSTLTEDSSLPSEKEAVSVLQTDDGNDLGISESQLNNEHNDNNSIASSSKNQQPNRNDVLSISSIINDQSNIENERTSINNEKGQSSIIHQKDNNEIYAEIASLLVPIVYIDNNPNANDGDSYNNLNESQYNDPQPDEYSDSDEEINEQRYSARKRKINQNFKTSKKSKKNYSKDKQVNKSSLEAQGDTNITTEHNEQVNDENSHILNRDIFEDEISDHDDISNNNGKGIDSAVSSISGFKFSTLLNQILLELQIGSIPIRNNHKPPCYYAEKLKSFRKTNGKLEIFVSNSGDQNEMYLQPIESYFKEDTTPTSFEPLPKPRMDIKNCLDFFHIWDQNFAQCGKEIINQHYKMLKLIYSLSEVFFTLLILCDQEQQREVSQKTLDKSTDNWKGIDIKSRMNKKIGNQNVRSTLKKWTACWRLHHFLWVTNVTPSEMIEVKLNAKYFFETTEKEYNLLIKELLKNSEFTEFRNPKGEKILELVNIAKNIYAI